MLGHRGGIFDVEFSPDGFVLASAGRGTTVRVWNAKRGQLLRTFRSHTGAVVDIGFSPDGKQLFSAGADGTVKVWNASQDQQHTSRSDEGLPRFQRIPDSPALQIPISMILSARISPKGDRIAWVGYESLTVLVQKGTALFGNAFTPEPGAPGAPDEFVILRQHKTPIMAIAFDSSGERLATGSQDGIVKVWNANNGEELATLSGHQEGVLVLVFSADSTRLAVASADNKVRIWNLKTTESEAKIVQNSRVKTLAANPSGMSFVTGHENGHVRIWNAVDGTRIASWKAHNSAINALAVTGERIATLGRTAKIWESTSGRQLAALNGFQGSGDSEILGPSLAFTPDGARIATVLFEKVSVWDSTTGQELLALMGDPGPATALFSPHGDHLAVGFGNTVKVWNGTPLPSDPGD